MNQSFENMTEENLIFCSEFETYEFINNSLTISRDCDKKNFEFLEIELNPNIDKNNFKNICDKILLKIKICEKELFVIPLRFMMLLNEFEFFDNKFYISIQFEMFCDDLKMICLQYEPVIFTLSNTENNFESCKMITKNTYIHSPERKLWMDEIVKTKHNFYSLIQNMTSIELNCKNPTNIFLSSLENGLYRGFFIECSNIDEIIEIKLVVSTQPLTIRNFNQFMIKMKCVKINQNLLYFPINTNKPLYKNRNMSDFGGILSVKSDNEYKLSIKFNKLQSKICIYKLKLNVLSYSFGFSDLKFRHDSSYTIKTYDEITEQSTIIENNTY
jgi:hypothetical protein